MVDTCVFTPRVIERRECARSAEPQSGQAGGWSRVGGQTAAVSRRMGFASDWLEAAFGRWTQRSAAARGATRRLLCVHGFGAFVRALAHAPDPIAAKCAALALGTLMVHIFILLRPQHIRWAQICTCSRCFIRVSIFASIFFH